MIAIDFGHRASSKGLSKPHYTVLPETIELIEWKVDEWVVFKIKALEVKMADVHEKEVTQSVASKGKRQELGEIHNAWGKGVQLVATQSKFFKLLEPLKRINRYVSNLVAIHPQVDEVDEEADFFRKRRQLVISQVQIGESEKISEVGGQGAKLVVAQPQPFDLRKIPDLRRKRLKIVSIQHQIGKIAEVFNRRWERREKIVVQTQKLKFTQTKQRIRQRLDPTAVHVQVLKIREESNFRRKLLNPSVIIQRQESKLSEFA